MLSPSAPTQSQAALSNRGPPHSEPNSQNLGCRGSRRESASLRADLCTPIQQPHESLHFPREDISEGMGRGQECLEKPFHVKTRGGIKYPSYNSRNDQYYDFKNGNKVKVFIAPPVRDFFIDRIMRIGMLQRCEFFKRKRPLNKLNLFDQHI